MKTEVEKWDCQIISKSIRKYKVTITIRENASFYLEYIFISRS